MQFLFNAKAILFNATLFLLLILTGCVEPSANAAEQVGEAKTTDMSQLAVATFAGGCFWCMEKPFDKLEGVVSTISGYTDGELLDPTYQQVSAGNTGHTEAVQITYDPTKVSYQKLLDVFWHNIDPLAHNRQFCDGGTQYRSGIYYHDEQQRELAEESKAKVAQKFDQTIATELDAASEFYPAEEYHQNYYKKNPIRYKYYRTGCGRDKRLKELWGAQAGS
ncbi:MAG: peptide-methionine (S)-S-oxide reductase MsrA [Pseudomonadales bacterium]